MSRAKDRVVLELEDLVVKHKALKEFIKYDDSIGASLSQVIFDNKIMDGLSNVNKNLLLEQERNMQQYRETLVLRLHYWE